MKSIDYVIGLMKPQRPSELAKRLRKASGDPDSYSLQRINGWKKNDIPNDQMKIVASVCYDYLISERDLTIMAFDARKADK